MAFIATIGSALAWFSTTAAYLIMWGCCLGVGIWISHRITGQMDNKLVAWLSEKKSRLKKKDSNNEEDVIAGSTLIPAT